MEWLLLLLGLVVGGVFTESFTGIVTFGLLGAVIGLGMQSRDQRRHLRAMQQELRDLRKRVARIGSRLDSGKESPGMAGESLVGQEHKIDLSPPIAASSSTEPVSSSEALPEKGGPEALTATSTIEGKGAEEELLSLDLSDVERQLSSTEDTSFSEEPEARVQPQAPDVEESPSIPRQPTLAERGFLAARYWLMGGNPLLKVGILLLFLGLAFLLRYAAERVTLPVEFRYIGVAAVAIALLTIGWWLRHKKQAYALSLQGAGIGILYLTVFAALHLHRLLSPGMAFALLLVAVVCATLLSVAQNALALALVSTIGGFAAPLLTTIGDHQALFGYYLLLNLGIVGVAWYKAWRPLNLVGFAGTFSIGLWWGLKFYQPALWFETELFLILFFLLYLLIGLLFAHRKLRQDSDAPPNANLSVLMRWAVGRTDYIDATLLFGPPLVGFGMQFAIISRFEFGPAYSALALGLLYLGLATLLWRRLERQRYLLVEVYLALGVIFGTLAVPLALDAQWTSAIWAVEGAGIYWVSLHQRRTLSRLFALLLQGGAAITFLSTLSHGDQTLLDGAYLSALMIGIALLFSHDRLHRWGNMPEAAWEGVVEPLLALAALGMLYLVPPLLLSLESCVAVWSVAGLLTLFAGLRLSRRIYLLPAFAVQLVAGGMFLLHLSPQTPDGGSGVFDAGWGGLFSAMLIGASLLAGVWLTMRDRSMRDLSVFRSGSSILVIIGLLLLNLAVLFVMPWQAASGIWAASGLAIVWLGLRLGHRVTFFFGLAIQLVGGIVFLQQFALLPMAVGAAALTPLSGAFFWSPLSLSLVAFAAAGLLQHRLRRESSGEAVDVQWKGLSDVALIWGAGWWAFTLYNQIVNFTQADHWSAYLLLGAALSSLLWSLPAKRYAWPSLGVLSLCLAPVGAVILLAAFHTFYHPAANLAWLGWLALFPAHLWMLKRLDGILPCAFRRAIHLMGIWLLLGVSSLEMRYLLMALAEQHNAWRWLGWAAVPSLYLMLVTFLPRLPWPVSAYGREYRVTAVLPVAGLMLAWILAAVVFSDGSAQPLPYLPLLNPLALSLLLALFSLFQWWRGVSESLPLDLRAGTGQAVMAAALFLVLTSEVFRTVHHWLAIPFQLDALLASMQVQATLSLLWTLMALAAMVFGTRRGRRKIWIGGAALIAVVVVKLFLVELSQHGSIERIFSFIGVGVLLLVVGYFSPLPPRQEAVLEEEAR